MRLTHMTCDLCREEWLTESEDWPDVFTLQWTPFRDKSGPFRHLVDTTLIRVEVCRECQKKIRDASWGLRTAMNEAEACRKMQTEAETAGGEPPKAELLAMFAELLERLGFTREGGAE